MVELVSESFRVKQGGINLVDVGANIGDTILLLEANCPKMIRRFWSVEGDPEFFAYLENNLAHLANGKLILGFLSSSQAGGRKLFRPHPGTSSAQGEGGLPSTTIDRLAENHGIREIDVLKVDVDGFDGKVLLGAQKTLQEYRPAVIFEWHPGLCKKTCNNWTDHFEALQRCGYSRFTWFTKFGDFSHFTEGVSSAQLAELAEFCLQTRTLFDWHYDVVALHDLSQISPLDLADLRFASVRRSRH